ncbi:MAG: T9SS type A sorting domain-containing protein [Ignavibacteriaceae bacterium]
MIAYKFKSFFNIAWNASSGASGNALNLSGPGLDTTIASPDTLAVLDSLRLKPKSSYTISVDAYNAYGDTTNATNNGVVFYTPTITGIFDKQNNTPNTFKLYQNYPNPFNPTTILKYSIPKSSIVTIKVYDLIGREVAVLVNEEKPAGDYSITFNASNLASGIYFYNMQAGSFEKTQKMILLK